MNLGIKLMQAVLFGLSKGSLYGLMGLGISLIFRTVDVMNFAHGNSGMFATFVALSVYLLTGNVVLMLLAGAAAGLVLGVLIDKFLMKRVKGLSHSSMLIITLGLLMIIEALAFAIWGTEPLIFPKVVDRAPLIVRLSKGMLILPANDLAGALIALGVSVALAFFFKYTKFGTAVRAKAQDVVGAQAVGVNTKSVDAAAWGIGIALSALVGMLIAYKSSVTPSMMVEMQIYGLTAAVLGGFSSLFGAIVGGLMLGLIQETVVTLMSAGFTALNITSSNPVDYQFSIILIIIIVMLAVKPDGLFASRFKGKV
ncbi:MAG TPA: branched-chain amino acid ABC transporter permease [Bacillota bacterium]|nr:branched-chain amino acid ABC transporter permease [Bacillota bacterium]HOH09715.1 branched-chain amino acid ABC transporter permease [Bacillota bacterium]HOS50161.1 branched-chain amino acid ABC transporter permease [Bacillota bacterium]HOY88318.1 branched-chain amino acid ABC transporter permease [Bacillota bacterium]HPI00602.1 branched-chain amino acid ABC transporter permease [Bacillota bacterium]